METESQSQTQSQKAKPLKTKSTMKKLDPQAAKLLAQLKDRANKKDFGRKIREKDILTIALKQVTDDHLKELQDQSLTEKDRLMQRHDQYCKAKGKITLDEFIGKLMRGEIITSESQKNSQTKKEV